MISFIIGAVIGGSVSIIAIACLIVGNDND